MSSLGSLPFPSSPSLHMGETVSIVIDNYNYDRFLGDAISSALSQTYAPVEVIVVDDGSTDDSVETIESFGDRIKPVLTANRGQGAAFNAGFSASEGSVVCFLDADDALYENAVEDAMDLLTRSHCAKVHWPLEIVDEGGDKIGRLFPPSRMPTGDLRQRTLDEGPLYGSDLLPPTSGNAWTRSFLQWALPVPEDAYRVGADVYLHALAPLFGPLGSLKRPAGFYRVHGDNLYWNRLLDPTQTARLLAQLEGAFDALSARLSDLGMSVDARRWETRNWNYLWLKRLQAMRCELSRILNGSEKLVLIGGEELGDPAAVLGRDVRFFPERDGVFDGPPRDSEAAIAELEASIRAGAQKLAVWWTSFWWLEHYEGFANYLRDRFPLLAHSDEVIVFDLASRKSRDELGNRN